MGFLSVLLGILGFGFGLPLGLLVGYFLFIYVEPTDVKDPIIRPLHELDSKTLRALRNEIPHWVKNPDYDRVDWLNKFVLDLWPFLDKAICGIIRSTAKPIFDQYTGKFFIESIEFDSLTLGSLPPTIHGVKVYETQERDLVIEPAVRWAGNPNITVVVNVFSLQMTVQLLDLQIFFLPRVTLKPLVPSFPCFANVSVSLMDKPHVDFGLKLLGVDIMAIPGLYRFIQEFVKEQVASFYHWPNTLEIPILDGSSGATKKPVGILHVKVVRALNLSKMDLFGKSDPYVKLKLSGERLPAKKTSIKMKNLNPEWNEQFKLIVKDPETQVLELRVYDWEKVGMHDKLGMQVVPLRLLTPHVTKEFTLDLLKNMNPNDSQSKMNRGKIMLEMTFDPFKDDNDTFCGGTSDGDGNKDNGAEESSINTPSNGGLLSVAVQGAEDVEGKYHNNPYAVILFRGEQKKTKVIKKSRDPRWDEEFQFMLEEAPIDDRIHIEVMSRRRLSIFHSKESLGHVDIKLMDVVNNGRINEKYHLINSKNGLIHIEIRWKTI
ncbi:synaptotagmin-3 [Cinnamomum micranthum f. kanehirae]|uniref:Synaptotagmin-3 n=1 Tax=Cinnamomum micranthum f. kanehirae TaxID=337451 RepID=A0A443Q0U4_9MAGN|nr:synaptotagmin-3 [Cinnamomum micranthum f. kanehirae]